MNGNNGKSYFEMVAEFNEKFGFPVAGEQGNLPHLMNDDNGLSHIADFRRKFLLEELNEFCSAQEDDDLVGIADALVDLVYVALGTAHYYGLPFDELFAEVQRANMDKVRVKHEGESKRRTEWDVLKPVGWKPPDIGLVLADSFFRKMMNPEE